MSKSIKRKNKYGDDYEDDHDRQHRDNIKERRFRAALKSKNIDALFDLNEEEY